MISFLTGYESEFLLKTVFCLVTGLAIGAEREFRGKTAGISTQSFVIGGSMLFTFISLYMDPTSPARVAAQVVSGVGFLGAGIILKTEGGKITNLTTAASIWFAAALGMAIGFGWYMIALIATLYAVIVPRIPQVRHQDNGK